MNLNAKKLIIMAINHISSSEFQFASSVLFLANTARKCQCWPCYPREAVSSVNHANENSYASGSVSVDCYIYLFHCTNAELHSTEKCRGEVTKK